MLEQLNTQLINITPEATKAVQDIIEERNLEGYALRIYAAGGGCCGMQFGMALDDNIKAEDSTMESGGIRLVVDDISLPFLQGASIDFVNHPDQRPGFVVNNPNSHQHEGEACACGGSCSCNH